MGERTIPSEGAKVAGLVCALLVLHCAALAASSDLKSYIVLLKDQAPSEAIQTRSQAEVDQRRSTLVAQHRAVVASAVTEASLTKPEILYSYTTVINAFAAQFTVSQVSKISSRSDVLQVIEDIKAKPSTTNTHKFLGLDKPKTGPWTKTNGTNVIVGMIDTGIWPENPSFNEKGYGPIPKKFKGICQTGQNFTKKHCNRKIIGARYFIQGYLYDRGLTKVGPSFLDVLSPRDVAGHGTHTASTASGSTVTNINIEGNAFGTSKGVAYASRLSIYKVCWNDNDYDSCSYVDIMAAMDQAVLDGVDVISISLGGLFPSGAFLFNYFAQRATKAGVSIVCAAGNYGYFGNVDNGSPWVLTVAASTTDRSFKNSITLASGVVIESVAISKKLAKTNSGYSLIDGEFAFNANSSSSSSKYCYPGTLDPKSVSNKVIFCIERWYSIADITYDLYKAGVVGVIIQRQPNSLDEDAFHYAEFSYLPIATIKACDGARVKSYIAESSNPTVIISAHKIILGSKSEAAPKMAEFSSKGPNRASFYLLKPDITAPGVDIVAAWSRDPRASNLPFNKTSDYAIISGTSMACPHVSGAVALIKALHPSWPPSWINSAIITTGTTMNNEGLPIEDADGFPATPFNMGGGHLNVAGALDPGLVFGTEDQEPTIETDLNLPSVSLFLLSKPIEVVRKLTLVGVPSTYNVVVSHPEGAKLAVSPSTLKFTKVGQTLAFRIHVTPEVAFQQIDVNYQTNSFTFGTIVWSDGTHRVKMNVAVNVPFLSS